MRPPSEIDDGFWLLLSSLLEGLVFESLVQGVSKKICAV